MPSKEVKRTFEDAGVAVILEAQSVDWIYNQHAGNPEKPHACTQRHNPDGTTPVRTVAPPHTTGRRPPTPPNTPSSRGHSPHTEEEPRQSAYIDPLRRRHPTEKPADTPKRDPTPTAPQQERPGITDEDSILEQTQNTIQTFSMTILVLSMNNF